MTKEEAIKLIKEHHDTSMDNCKDSEAMRMAIKALSQESCRKDCRLCKEFDECENGKKGHKNGTSIGYSIGECKDYKPCTDAVSREAVLQAVSEGCFELRGVYGRCEELINALPSVNPQPCDDAISREDAIKKLRADTLFVCTGDKMQAISDIEDLPPVTQKLEWIPVSKRTPKDGIPCICTVYNTDVYKDNIQVYDYYLMYDEDTEQWSDDNMDLCPYDVLAWMPLPHPYEPQERSNKE